MKPSYWVFPGLQDDETIIVKSIYKYFKLDPESYKLKRQTKDLTRVKQMSMKVLVDYFGLHPVAVKDIFSVDRTNVIYSVLQHDNIYSTDRDYKKKFDELLEQLSIKYRILKIKTLEKNLKK